MNPMEGPAHLRLAHYRFALEALEPLSLPPYKGAVLRGGFGHVFRRTVCLQREREACPGCLLRQNCPYAVLFDPAPPPGSEVLRTQSDVPLPFVLEPPLDRRTRYDPGDTLAFGLTLVGRGIAYLPYFILVFGALGEQGLGRGRGRYRLAEVDAVQSLDGRQAGVYTAADETVQDRDLAIGWDDLAAAAGDLPGSRLAVEFLTPMRLKSDGHLADRPEFSTLIRALLRRVSSLAYFHCGQRWETDYRGWIERAGAVHLVEDRTEWRDWERYSSRQDARLKMGGIVGRAVYEGEIGPFRPLLKLGELVHVGKATVMGNGLYRAGPA